MRYVIALDSGTTSQRCIIFDENRNIVCMRQNEFPQYYPKPGWVEQKPDEIYSAMLCAVRSAVACVRAGDASAVFAAAGVTNQRETAIIWDKSTGECVYNAIVWQCRRTSDYCSAIAADRTLSDELTSLTGLRPDAYFSASKIRWILENVPGTRRRAENGELLFGTVDSWLIWRLSGGRFHITDHTNACRTMLYDINRREWSARLCDIFGVAPSMLPKIVSSSGEAAYIPAEVIGAERDVVISGIAGDQQAALYGHGCTEDGSVKNTYGTGCFMLMNTGTRPVFDHTGLLTTIVCSSDGSPAYGLEGSVFTAGAVIKWLRDELRMIERSSDTEEISRQTDGTNGVYVVPAFSGLGAPWWDSDARGIICGLTRGSNRAHIVRACVESIAYQTADVLALMRAASGLPIDELAADGGASANDFLMQFQSDISDVRIVRPDMVEVTAEGAAALAALAVGMKFVYDSQSNTVFGTRMEAQQRSTLLSGWHIAVKRASGAENGDSM